MAVALGYSLSSEEHAPPDLVRHARAAERAGFSFAFVSDHFHPWVTRQGQSGFAWTVVGAIAQATERLRLGTGVTCPLLRLHPAVVAHAAATAATLMPGRFVLGVGTGENLNEHVTGERWPEPGLRLEMLEEAIGVIRRLFTGRKVSHRGRHFTVDEACLFSLPDEPPPIYVAGGGPRALALAGRAGDGLVSTNATRAAIDRFDDHGGAGKPRVGHVAVCWDETEAAARRVAHEWWPNAGIRGDLTREVKTTWLFDRAVSTVREEDVAEQIVCGPDADRHRAAIRRFVDAGYDHVYIHQIGPRQDEYIEFCRREILPRFG